MKKYLSHFSAALLWNIPCLEAVVGREALNTRTSHITVTDRKARFRSRDVTVHSCIIDLPAGAVVMKKGQKVSSPELLFLELASQLSIHQLILLGLQMCSHPPGAPYRAVTTKQRLASFLSRTSWYHGHNKAVRAVKYVKNGSASIMESLSYMILTLPHALGGYGLSGAVFNQEIILQGEAINQLNQTRCFADLYYKDARLAVEYDSFAHHNSPLEQGKDSKRSALLESQGIEVLKMNTIQLYDPDACRTFAYNLAYRLKKRIAIRTKKFDDMHAKLRTLLPGGIQPPVLHDNNCSKKPGSAKTARHSVNS